MAPLLWKILFVLANSAADVSWALAKRFGSRAWGGVEGAYRFGRRLRQTEVDLWLPSYQAARKSTTAGDIDDSAYEVAKGHGRYELEEYHIVENLDEVVRLVDAADVAEARILLRSQIEILRTGRPGLGG